MHIYIYIYIIYPRLLFIIILKLSRTKNTHECAALALWAFAGDLCFLSGPPIVTRQGPFSPVTDRPAMDGRPVVVLAGRTCSLNSTCTARVLKRLGGGGGGGGVWFFFFFFKGREENGRGYCRPLLVSS